MAARKVRTLGTGKTDLGADQGIVAIPIGLPASEVLVPAPGPVHVMMQATAEIGGIGHEARAA